MLSYRDLIDFAEKLCSDAEVSSNEDHGTAYLIGSILNSWMAMESFINNMMNDFASLPDDIFTTHERGFLEERRVRFIDNGKEAGRFHLENSTDYKRLEDKILFLIARFGKSKRIDKGHALWQRFERIKIKRNAIAHPRRSKLTTLETKDAREAISVAKEVISLVSKEVWKRPVVWD